MKIVHITSKHTFKFMKAVRTGVTPWRVRLAFWIAYRLPKRIVYWAAVRVWANTLTDSKYAHDDITKVTMAEATTKWERTWRLR